MVQDPHENCWFGRVTGSADSKRQHVVGLFSDVSVALDAVQPKVHGDHTLGAGDIVHVSVVDNHETGGHSNPEDAIRSITLEAPADSAGARVFALLEAFKLNPSFPEACEAEARAWLADTGIDDESLTDLLHLPFVTIDNADSRDLDQAIYIEHHGVDKAVATAATVYYALADASYYVGPGSALFKEALERTVTYYAPDMAVPMLPRALSEGLVSLNPLERRRALVFSMSLDGDGNVTDTTILRARIKSRAKLSYREVQEFIDQSTSDNGKHNPHPIANTEFNQSLLALETVGRARIQQAERRDVVQYDRSEASVRIDANDHFRIEQRNRYDTERYNEQISLMCNMEGAKLLSRHSSGNPNLHSIFRVHGPPLEERIENLRHDIASLVQTRELPASWIWKQGQSLSDYLDGLPTSAEHSPVRQAIERMILLTNRASLFSDEPGIHHALGVELYARFSSPMREMVGIFLHKELLEALGLENDAKAPIDGEIQELIIERSNQARKTQKKLEQEARLIAIEQYFHNDLGKPINNRPRRRATIMGMRGGKIYFQVDGFGADIKVYTDDLGQHFGCRYKVDGFSASPTQNKEGSGDENAALDAPPVLTVGDRYDLVTKEYDEKRRRFIFLPMP